MGERLEDSSSTGSGLAAAGSGVRQLWRHTLLRLGLLYLVPLVLISLVFHYQHHRLIAESRRAHLRALAESQASTLDLFLRERWVNLFNVIDDLRYVSEPSEAQIRTALGSLRRTSQAFVDLGLLDERGRLLVYAGPHEFLRTRDYSGEPWFRELADSTEPYTVTDIYAGFRDELHFTIAVRREVDRAPYVVRAALSPEELYREIAATEQRGESWISLIDRDGDYQLVSSDRGEALARSPYRPPDSPPVGIVDRPGPGAEHGYAYAWLATAPWAVVAADPPRGLLAGLSDPIYGATVVFNLVVLLVGCVVLWLRARYLVRFHASVEEKEAVLSGQLVQAAKLASVGELAAGIAHEINNPLAIIAEEAGLIADLRDPRYGQELSSEELDHHLATIRTAVFRCRDITRKLLTFVRQDEVDIRPHDLNEILDEAAEGLLGSELAVSNIEVAKDYARDLPMILTDRNQLVQVLVNLLRNAIDAMGNAGRLTLRSARHGDTVSLTVEDTGSGMTSEQLGRIFMPFFTTKEPGKGTGLGLSVSYSIVKSLGGDIHVESAPGRGSRFRVDLPVGGAEGPGRT
jgi:two-component system NtrC family sensor kinase